MNGDHIEAAATQIGDKAAGAGDAGQYAFGSETSFLFARQDADRAAPCRFGSSHKFLTIAGVPRCRRCNGLADIDTMRLGQHAKSAQCLKRKCDAFVVEFAGRHHVATDGADRFFVVNNCRRPRQAFVDDQADGIRTDVDDGDRAAAATGTARDAHPTQIDRRAGKR